jgi:hypothetical protein
LQHQVLTPLDAGRIGRVIIVGLTICRTQVAAWSVAPGAASSHAGAFGRESVSATTSRSAGFARPLACRHSQKRPQSRWGWCLGDCECLGGTPSHFEKASFACFAFPKHHTLYLPVYLPVTSTDKTPACKSLGVLSGLLNVRPLRVQAEAKGSPPTTRWIGGRQTQSGAGVEVARLTRSRTNLR